MTKVFKFHKINFSNFTFWWIRCISKQFFFQRWLNIFMFSGWILLRSKARTLYRELFYFLRDMFSVSRTTDGQSRAPKWSSFPSKVCLLKKVCFRLLFNVLGRLVLFWIIWKSVIKNFSIRIKPWCALIFLIAQKHLARNGEVIVHQAR